MRPPGSGRGSVAVELTLSNSGATMNRIPSGENNCPTRNVDELVISSNARAIAVFASFDGAAQRSRTSRSPSSTMANETPLRYSTDGTGSRRASPTSNTLYPPRPRSISGPFSFTSPDGRSIVSSGSCASSRRASGVVGVFHPPSPIATTPGKTPMTTATLASSPRG